MPVNVNFRYQAHELRYLLDNSDARALVHAAEFSTTAQEATGLLAAAARPLLLEAGEPYERALATSTPPVEWTPRTPAGDDLIFLYTGGTTGAPKGVMWRNDDLYVALWASSHPGSPEPPDPWAAARAGKRASTLLPAAPLMHGTGLFAAVAALAGSGTVVLVDHPGLDPERVWDAVAREGVQTLTIVGDVFARPLLDALRAAPDRWDLSSLRAITSSGVLFSPDVKRGLLDRLDGVTIVDSLGASEGLGPRQSAARATPRSPRAFSVNERIRVVDEDTGRDVEPGSGAIGLLAMGGRIPLGYFKDPEKSAATFRTLDGVRYSIPGDYATVETDGTVRLLGRGSACINTGGEKVYPEEVEAELRNHPDVFDCVVVGVPDERYGERVVALVQVTGGADARRGRDGGVVPRPHGRVQVAATVPRRRLAPAFGRGQGAPPGAARAGGRAAGRRDRTRLTTSDACRRGQAPRASGRAASSTAGAARPRCCGPSPRPGRGRCASPRRARRRPRPSVARRRWRCRARWRPRR